MNQRLSDTDLATFKEILLKKKNHSEEQIKYYQDQLESMAENGRDESNVLQNSNEYINMEYTLLQLSRQKKHLSDIDQALERVARKTFGLCTITGNLIDKKRLMAVPTTTKSLSNGKKVGE